MSTETNQTKHEETAADRVLRKARELSDAQRAAHHETMSRRREHQRQTEEEHAKAAAAEAAALPAFPAPIAAQLERDEVTVRELGPAAHLDPEIRDELAGIARRRRVWERWQVRKQIETAQRSAAEHAAANAPKAFVMSATMTAPTDVMVISGHAIGRGALAFEVDGARHVLRPAALVSFLPAGHPAIAAIEATRAARVDYLRRTSFGYVPADEDRWNTDADETVGFAVSTEDAPDVLAVALRASNRSFLSGEGDPYFRELLDGCSCPRARVRWLDAAEMQGRTLTPLVLWAERSREAVEDARRFWSEAGADLETANG